VKARVRSAILALCLAALTALDAHAQGRPAGAGRGWIELGITASRQTGRCIGCTGSSAVGGPSVSAAAGITLPHCLGVALLARNFVVFSFDFAQSSQYVVALAQYTPPSAGMLTLNAGVGRGRHSEDQGTSNGVGAVLHAGAAVRIVPRSMFALSLTADVVQSVGGSPSSHPRLISVGLGIGGATSTPTP
jgi:hypothetical protein